MADCTVQQVYDYLRFGKPGHFVKFCCPKRTVTIQRVSGGIDTMPTAALLVTAGSTPRTVLPFWNR